MYPGVSEMHLFAAGFHWQAVFSRWATASNFTSVFIIDGTVRHYHFEKCTNVMSSMIWIHHQRDAHMKTSNMPSSMLTDVKSKRGSLLLPRAWISRLAFARRIPFPHPPRKRRSHPMFPSSTGMVGTEASQSFSASYKMTCWKFCRICKRRKYQMSKSTMFATGLNAEKSDTFDDSPDFLFPDKEMLPFLPNLFFSVKYAS